MHIVSTGNVEPRIAHSFAVPKNRKDRGKILQRNILRAIIGIVRVGKRACQREAEIFVRHVVANELDVRFAHERIDPDIARDALDALKRHLNVPPGIGVTVREGDITLTGTVEWMFQKMAAERAVRYLKGVRGVFNDVVMTAKVSPKDVQRHVLAALHRHADLDARLIRVTAEGASVILDGNVLSESDKDEAFRVAWAAPGVIAVNNRLVVVPQESVR